MPEVTYIGRHGVVLVPLPVGGEAIAEWGKPFETSEEHAKKLLEQPENWKRASKPSAVKEKE